MSVREKCVSTYIYAYSNDNVLGHSWYVGKANDIEERWRACRREKRENNCRKWDLVQAHLKARTKPFIHTLEIVPMEQCDEREKYWIAFGRAQGWPLTNISRGGGLGTHREDTLKRMVAKQLGVRPSLETREKLRASHLGCKHTLEHVAKARTAATGKKRPPEFGERIRARQLGKKHSLERCANISKAKKGKPSPKKGKPGPKLTLETRAKMSVSHTGKKHSALAKRHMSEAAKLRYQRKRGAR